MPSLSLSCPQCRARSEVNLPAGTLWTKCPACNGNISLLTVDKPSIDENLEFGEPIDDDTVEVPIQPKKKRPRKSWFGRQPAWAWAILGIVVVGIGGVIAGAVYLNDPPKPEVAVQQPPPMPGPRFPPLNQPPPMNPGGFSGDVPAKAAAPLAQTSPALADLIYLLPSDSYRHLPQMVGMAGSDNLELVRQSLWLAATEEFGLRVRDAALGEAPANGLPADRLLRVREAHGPHLRWSLSAGLLPNEHRLWSGYFQREDYQPEKIAAWIEQLEILSRGFNRQVIEAMGFEHRPRRLSEASVPADAAKFIERMRETDQFAAIRLLHAAIREKGESEALVAALSRAYATLGLMTEFYPSAATEAYKARGLLLAQRLVARSPKSAFARQVRAYAAAFAGYHHMALKDLADAKDLMEEKRKPPPWLEPLEAYLHFDAARLDAARRNADTPLIHLLRFLVREEPTTGAATIAAGRKFLDAEPECYRVLTGLCRTGGVGHLHGATVAGLAVFTDRMPRRIREQPGMPEAISGSVANPVEERNLYESLKKAGTSPDDAGEPSWSAFARLLQDIRFTLIVERLDFMARVWSVPTDEMAREAATILVGHPFLPLIESYQIDALQSPQEVLQKLNAAPVKKLDLRHMAYYYRLQQIQPGLAQSWYSQASILARTSFSQSTRHLQLTLEEDAIRGKFGSDLLKISPHSPIGQARALREAGSTTVARFRQIEKDYADHAVVQKALGERHSESNRMDDAVRCWKRWLELSPDASSYQKLAQLYLSRGLEEKWRETLEAGLEVEDNGLEHAGAQVALARYYTNKKEYRKALPYARAAAESGAGWALITAAECEENVHHWGSANQYYREAAERYGDPAFRWYFACRAYGEMDAGAAEQAIRDYLAKAGDPLPLDKAFDAGRYYFCKKDYKTSLKYFRAVNARQPNGINLVMLVLAADGANEAGARNLAFVQMTRLPNDDAHKPIGEMYRSWIEAKSPPGDRTFEEQVGELRPLARADAEFVFGCYLQARGDRDRALAHWKKCQDSTVGTRLLRTHARVLSESMKK